MKGFCLGAAALFCALGMALMGGCTKSVNGGEAAAPPVAGGMEEETGPVYRKLTQEEAKARMDSGDAPVILDVRTKEEYDAGHIAGALLLPNESIGTEPPPELPELDAEILIYCRSGNRSAQAAKKLVGMGYTAVYDFGGINSWAYGVVQD